MIKIGDFDEYFDCLVFSGKSLKIEISPNVLINHTGIIKYHEIFSRV